MRFGIIIDCLVNFRNAIFYRQYTSGLSSESYGLDSTINIGKTIGRVLTMSAGSGLRIANESKVTPILKLGAGIDVGVIKLGGGVKVIYHSVVDKSLANETISLLDPLSCTFD